MQETQDEILEEVVNSEYKYGFITDIETDDAPIVVIKQLLFGLVLNNRVLFMLRLFLWNNLAKKKKDNRLSFFYIL